MTPDEIQLMITALKLVHHELTALHGLTAFDTDSREDEAAIHIDTSAATEALDAVLAALNSA